MFDGIGTALGDQEYYGPLEALGDIGGRLEPSRVADGWQRTERDIWVGWRRPGVGRPGQGWKIHVSARLERAQDVLDVVADICRAEGVPFKHVAGRRFFLALHHKHADRAQAGKFCAVYPRDTETAARLLDALSAALDGEEGPYILSDRRYRDSRTVHYRYGGFGGRSRLLPDGTREPLIRDGSGRDVPDVRRPAFVLPVGVTDPFVTEEPAQHTGPIVIRHYEIAKVLQPSNAGGAYQAVDTRTGQRVFIKEARAHNGYTWDGVSAQERLRREYEVLSAVHAAAPGVCPEPFEYFTEWEHDFLVTEYVEGVQLRNWVGRHSPIARTEWSAEDSDRYFGACRLVLRSLDDALALLHAQGYRFGDLSPGNVLVTADGRARLVDFEAATPLSGPPAAMGTAGFAPPRDAGDAGAAAAAAEAVGEPGVDARADAEPDGAAVAGADPEPGAVADSEPDAVAELDAGAASEPGADAPAGADLVADAEPDAVADADPRTATENGPHPTPAANPLLRDQYGMAALALSLFAPPLQNTAGRTPSHLALLRRDVTATPTPAAAPPADLWARATAFPGADDHRSAPLPTPADVDADPEGCLADLARRVATGLLDAADAARPGWVFPPAAMSFQTNTVCVAYGTAGVVHALLRAGVPVPEEIEKRLVEDALAQRDDLPPGLDAGSAGIARVLAQLGRLDEATDLLRTAEDHPLTRTCSTLAGGRAGIGLSWIALYRRTHDVRHLERAAAAGEAILRTEDLVPTLGEHDARGLFHGRSGIALFLHQLAGETGQSAYFEAGRRLLHEELDRAVPLPDGGLSYADNAVVRRAMPYLAVGSAGVATALTRYVATDPDERCTAALPLLAADARKTCALEPGFRTGLAGLTYFLAEHAELTGRATDRESAVRAATGLLKYAIPHGEGVRYFGEGGVRYAADLSGGAAGVLLALVRVLRGPGDELFTLDPRRPGTVFSPAFSANGSEGRPT